MCLPFSLPLCLCVCVCLCVCFCVCASVGGCLLALVIVWVRLCVWVHVFLGLMLFFPIYLSLCVSVFVSSSDWFMLWWNADVRYLPASPSQDSGWSLFSATIPPEALEITRKFMNKPLRILMKREMIWPLPSVSRSKLHSGFSSSILVSLSTGHTRRILEDTYFVIISEWVEEKNRVYSEL